MYTLEPITVDNVPELVRLARIRHADSPYARIPFDPVEVRLFVRQCDGNDNVFMRYLMQDDEAIGFICCMRDKYIFANVHFVEEKGLYVIEPHRSYAAARMLIGAGEAWARDLGAQAFVVGVTGSDEAERIGKLYERLQFAPWGNVYRKELV